MFRGMYEELDLAKPVSAIIRVMQKQRESMRIVRLLSSLPSSFDSIHAQLLGSKELPSLSEALSRL